MKKYRPFQGPRLGTNGGQWGGGGSGLDQLFSIYRMNRAKFFFPKQLSTVKENTIACFCPSCELLA